MLRAAGAAAIHFVGGRPGERDARIRGGGDHRGALRGLGGELGLVRDVRPLSPLTVVAPGLRQIEPEIEQGVGTSGHVGGEHDGLAVFHLPGDPGMLPGSPTLAWPFFSSAVSSSTTIAPGSPSRATMNRCSAASAAAQSQACSASRACIRRGVACPAVSASCQHDLRSPGSASSAPIYANAVSRDLACANTPASSPNSSRLELSQPGPVFYDGTGGHLIVSSQSRSMIMGWPLAYRTATQVTPRSTRP